MPISIEHRDQHIWVVKEKGGSSNVYISMHLPLLRVEGLGSKSSGRHTYTGAIQHDRVAHLAAVSKDMPSTVASSVKALPHSEEITLTDQTEFNDLFSLSKNMQLSGCIIIVESNGLEVICKHLPFRLTMGGQCQSKEEMLANQFKNNRLSYYPLGRASIH